MFCHELADINQVVSLQLQIQLCRFLPGLGQELPFFLCIPLVPGMRIPWRTTIAVPKTNPVVMRLGPVGFAFDIGLRRAIVVPVRARVVYWLHFLAITSLLGVIANLDIQQELKTAVYNIQRTQSNIGSAKAAEL